MTDAGPPPWRDPAECGRSLRGLTLNLLVVRIDRALEFQRDVLGAMVLYADEMFAAMAGAELRLHGCDPDRAEAAARRLGFAVLAPAADKPHGLREVVLRDPDGYIWVPDRPL